MAIFATVFGLVNLALSTGDGLTGPILPGYFYDTTCSYDTALTLVPCHLHLSENAAVPCVGNQTQNED